LLWREEHGNTFAHEIEHFIGFIGIPAKRGRNYKIRIDGKIPILPHSILWAENQNRLKPDSLKE